MVNFSLDQNQIHQVANFQELVSTPFQGQLNAICWSRNLIGDFSEIANNLKLEDNITSIKREELSRLELSNQGQLARTIILNDFELLQAHGASPSLNLINHYDRDDSFFPTDVYSFHVDRSPIETATFLCTYYGESSEILPNDQGEQKVLIPEIRNELKNLYTGSEEGFEAFLTEYFFDLHYHAKPAAQIISLGVGNLWKLAVDYPNSPSLPCLHRAPKEKQGQNRLMIIC